MGQVLVRRSTDRHLTRRTRRNKVKRDRGTRRSVPTTDGEVDGAAERRTRGVDGQLDDGDPRRHHAHHSHRHVERAGPSRLFDDEGTCSPQMSAKDDSGTGDGGYAVVNEGDEAIRHTPGERTRTSSRLGLRLHSTRLTHDSDSTGFLSSKFSK